MPKRSGGKFADSHTTVIDAAVSLVDEAARMPEVTKIALGLITQAGRGRGATATKFTDIPAGLLVKVRGSSSVQEIRIYTKEPSKVRQVLTVPT